MASVMSVNGLERLEELVEAEPREESEPPDLEENGGVNEDSEQEHFSQIERDLDTLTYSGSTINELEIQLTKYKRLYRRILVEAQTKIDSLRKKLNSHIVKSEPFIDVWRRARQVQEESNKAAVRFDKANSQYAASKEMIKMAEMQLGSLEIDMASPLNQAWQEMLNHATEKVFGTEKERRESETEHRRVLEDCRKVMEEYRSTERKLRTHIEKSRPFFLERSRANEKLQKLRQHIQGLEGKIRESKDEYTATLRRLEALNTEIHEQRRNVVVRNSSHGHHLGVREADPRETASAGHSPTLQRSRLGEGSLESLHLGNISIQYTGSTGSLQSTGTSSLSAHSSTPESNGVLPAIKTNHKRISPSADVVLLPEVVSNASTPDSAPTREANSSNEVAPEFETTDEERLARDVVERSLASAIKKLVEESDRSLREHTH